MAGPGRSESLAFAAGLCAASLAWYLCLRRAARRQAVCRESERDCGAAAKEIKPRQASARRRHLFVGVDLGATTISCVCARFCGTVVVRSTCDLGSDRSFEAVTKQIVSEVRKLVILSGCVLDDVVAVGVGAPGDVDSDGGVVRKAANFDWEQAPLRDAVAVGIGRPTVIENDANAAMLAEFWLGAGAGGDVRHMIMITLGTGIGGGIISDGRLIRGATGMAGELGHAIVESGIGAGAAEARLCKGTGVRGVLEQYASARALAARATEALAASDEPSSLRKKERGTLSAKDVFEHAGAGDELAVRLVEETADYLSVGLINACRAYDPQLIVLAGGLSEAGAALLGPLRRHFQRRWWSIQHAGTCRIEIASLGNNSGALGAAAAARFWHLETTAAAGSKAA